MSQASVLNYQRSISLTPINHKKFWINGGRSPYLALQLLISIVSNLIRLFEKICAIFRLNRSPNHRSRADHRTTYPHSQPSLTNICNKLSILLSPIAAPVRSWVSIVIHFLILPLSAYQSPSCDTPAWSCYTYLLGSRPVPSRRPPLWWPNGQPIFSSAIYIFAWCLGRVLAEVEPDSQCLMTFSCCLIRRFFNSNKAEHYFVKPSAHKECILFVILFIAAVESKSWMFSDTICILVSA